MTVNSKPVKRSVRVYGTSIHTAGSSLALGNVKRKRGHLAVGGHSPACPPTLVSVRGGVHLAYLSVSSMYKLLMLNK